MINTDQYIEQGLTIVNALISQGNLPGALSACNELLKVNPYHRGTQKTLKNIETMIVRENEKKVAADIDATMHLWNEGKYQELLEIYNRLYPFAPQYERLRNLITKVQEKLSDTSRKERQEYIDKAQTVIGDLLNQKQYGNAIQACGELLEIDPLNARINKYLESAQNNLIDQKLHDNQRLLESSDLERILDFYNTLLSIRPDHDGIKKRATQIKAEIAERKVIAAKIHLNESITRMKDLFKAAEYEKVLQAAEEIDRLDPSNVSAAIYRKKAIETMRAETDTAMVKKLKENQVTLLPEYAKNPAAFVKI